MYTYIIVFGINALITNLFSTFFFLNSIFKGNHAHEIYFQVLVSRSLKNDNIKKIKKKNKVKAKKSTGWK